MALNSNQIMRYLALLADPNQNEITRSAWTVASDEHDIVWAGWQPDSVVSVRNEPPADWYNNAPPPAPVAPVAERARTRADERSTAALGVLKQLGIVSPDFDPANPGSFGRPAPDPEPTEPVTPPPGIAGNGLKRLATLDELHREEALGRAGWLFVAGTIRRGEQEIPCCFPLFERNVNFVRVRGNFYPQWQGALRRNGLVRRQGDDRVQDEVDLFLSAGAGSSDLAAIGQIVTDLLRHFDVLITKVADPNTNPLSFIGTSGLTLVPGTGFYLGPPSNELTSASNDLTRWTTRHLSDTAFAEIYRTTDSALTHRAGDVGAIRTALPLNERQREAIDRLDTETVVTVSGPPGTGKTHMIVAAACDLVARDLSVLVATKSDFAAESACELLAQYPTPPHVRFGREEHRRQVADLLSSGSSLGITDEQFAALDDATTESWKTLGTLGASALAALDRNQAFERSRVHEHLALGAGAPRILESGFDFGQLDRLTSQASAQPGIRQRRALSRLHKLVGAHVEMPLASLLAAVQGAKAERTMSDALENAIGPSFDDLWAELDRAESDARAAQAVLDYARRSRPSRESLASVAALATALRTSLDTHELQIPVEANAAFLHHLPFWVGTLDEIEATLPANPGMFDVVIFDEASQIDQLAAVPALCRAKRVIVVGDPKQLRHASAITSQQIDDARTHAALRPGDDAAILNVAANSLFDVAAATAPVTWLDEHFRSVPHLIHFASERWYGNHLRLMTQHPRNEHLDAIHTHRSAGQRQSQTNQHEVTAIVAHVAALHKSGHEGSVGVISPFIEQAQALETALVDAFDYDTIRALRLRVGTVRGVQGTERDTILVSLVIDDRDFGVPLDMMQDPHVFNVMTTRARSRMDFFHSFDPNKLPPGLLADWFRYEAEPPGLIDEPIPRDSAWTNELAQALELSDLRVIVGYPVAGWSIDLVVGEGDAAFGVETTVHPDGSAAHAERRLALRRAGWDLVTMFESNWLLQTEQAAARLAGIAARRKKAGDRP